MNFTCLSRGNGFNFPPHYILNVSEFRILLDCPLDLSALPIFAPLTTNLYSLDDGLDMGVELTKKQKLENPLDAKTLIHAEPWYRTAKNLQLCDPSSIDIVLISSVPGMLGLPFLTKCKGFSAKIYVTEATARLGKLMMEDLISMHMEFRQFYGREECGYPQWIKWEKLELLPSALRDVIVGKDGINLGEWMPLYSTMDVQDCMRKVQTLKYAEAACYNGTLVIKAFSSGLEIGSCNWSINAPTGNIACILSSTFVSIHAMEFDYGALQGNDLILYSDLKSLDVIDVELDDSYSAQATETFSTLRHCSANENNQKYLNECLRSDEESMEERDKLAFICSCIVDSVKAGGSALIPLNHIGISLQLLEQIALEVSALEVPIFIISSVASELLEYSNIIPEWLCKQQQEKLFSGEPLFSHAELKKGKKLHVFPSLHSPDLLTNWQEPCIIFSSHWSLRLGPIVNLLRRWCGDQHSLLVLEDGLDANMALMPFKPLAMKVLRCSFLSGIRLRKVPQLLKILQPEAVLFPVEWRQHIRAPITLTVHFYAENEALDIPKLKDHLDLEISEAGPRWSKLIESSDAGITRLAGQLVLHHGKHRLVPSDTGVVYCLGSLVAVLSEKGITASIKSCSDNPESNIIKIDAPNDALIQVEGTRTIISTSSKTLSTAIVEAIVKLLDDI